MDTIENKEIRGLTAKVLLWFFGGIISVIISVMAAAFAIKSDNKDTRVELRAMALDVEAIKKAGDTRDTELKTINLQIQTMQLQIARIEEQINNNKNGK